MATVTVRSKTPEGFRRCGMKFTPEARTLVVGTEITEAQLKILKEEKMLTVEVVSDEPEGSTAKELIAKIKTMDDVKALGEMFKGETRSTVKDALKERIKELKATQE